MYGWTDDETFDAIFGANVYYDRTEREWLEIPDHEPPACRYCGIDPWLDVELDRWFCDCDADPDQPWYEMLIEQERGRMRNDGAE